MQLLKQVSTNFIFLKNFLSHYESNSFGKLTFFKKSNDFEYFFFLFKYFLFFKNFNKFFFINFLFFKNFSKNNIYYFNKSIFLHINAFTLVGKILPKKKFLHKKYVKRNFAKHLISLYPTTSLSEFGDFMLLRRFFFKNTNIFSTYYRSKRFFQFKFLRRFKVKKKLINRFSVKKLSVLKVNRATVLSNHHNGGMFFFKKNLEVLEKQHLLHDKINQKLNDIFFLKNLTGFSKKNLLSNFLHFNIFKKNEFLDKNKFLDNFFLNTRYNVSTSRVVFIFLKKLYNLAFLFKSAFFKKKKKIIGDKKYIFIKRLFLFYTHLMPLLLTDSLVFVFFKKYFFSKSLMSKFMFLKNDSTCDIFFRKKNNYDDFIVRRISDMSNSVSIDYVNSSFFNCKIDFFCASIVLLKQSNNLVFNSFYVSDFIFDVDGFNRKNLFFKKNKLSFLTFKNLFFDFLIKQSQLTKKKFFLKFSSPRSFCFIKKNNFFKSKQKKSSFFKLLKELSYRLLKHKFAYKSSNGRRFLTIKPQRINMSFLKNFNTHDYDMFKKNVVNNNVLTLHIFNLLKRKRDLVDGVTIDISPVHFFDNFFYLNLMFFFKKNGINKSSVIVSEQHTHFSFDNFFLFYSHDLYFNFTELCTVGCDFGVVLDNTQCFYFNARISDQFAKKLDGYEPVSIDFINKTTTYFNTHIFNDFLKNSVKYDFFLENYTSDSSILEKFTYGYAYSIFESKFYLFEQTFELIPDYYFFFKKNFFYNFFSNFLESDYFFEERGFNYIFEENFEIKTNFFFEDMLNTLNSYYLLNRHDLETNQKNFIFRFYLVNECKVVFKYLDLVGKFIFQKILINTYDFSIFHFFKNNQNSINHINCYNINNPKKPLILKKNFLKTIKNYENLFDILFFKRFIYLNFLNFFKKLNMSLWFLSSNFSNSFLVSLLNRNWSTFRSRFNKKFIKDSFVNFQKSIQTVYTSNTPFGFISDFLKRFIFKKLRNQTTPSFFKFVMLFIVPSLQTLVNQRVSLRVIPLSKLKPDIKIVLNSIFFKKRNFQSKVGRGFFLNEMLEILYLTFSLRDLNFLKRWFLLTMERIQFQKHKSFLRVFKNIVLSFGDFFILGNGVKGFFLDVRGKVGVTGDAKKRNFYLNFGKRSKTTKNSKYDYQSGVVRTETGQLGITFIMFF